jgi:hypothetical protein
MQFALVAVAVGIAVGYATGGRLRHVGTHPVRGWGLLVVGAALQLPGRSSAVIVLLSLATLVAFLVLNTHLVGVGIIAVGLGLNALVIAANGAMPVRPAAAVRVGLQADELGGGRRLERPGDRLTGLGDIVPLRPVRHVLSFGDLVVAVGTADVVVHLMQRRRRRLQGAGWVSGPRSGGRLPRRWSPTHKPSLRPRSVPAVADEVTPESSVVSSAATSAPSKPAGRAEASDARSKASARGS